MKESLKVQVGGSHYKNMAIQPIEFIVNAKLTFIQGNIIKYISRYKDKNGAQDIKKCIHYANLSIDLDCKNENLHNTAVGLAYTYCKANNLSDAQRDIIVATAFDDYYKVKRLCGFLLKKEYPNEL